MTEPLPHGSDPVRVGCSIGPYRILRLLGQGGMGAVYAAEQDNPRRLVALKVLRGEALSAELSKRFVNEAHVLARLQHPGIAQIHHAGTFEAGGGIKPYFAMELIEGARLDEYVSERALSTEERLTLLAKVCDGVQHAHERGVIHRDLKPANILVDASGQPKILDFGVARLTNSDQQFTTMITEAGQIVGTLPYMSPEQVTEMGEDVDARSDVYALGVIAHQVLTGEMPYALRGMAVWDAIQVIRNVEPSPLSSVSRTFRGDLDTIVQKALAKDRRRRYATAGDLADDLRRFLAKRPIAARPTSTVYKLSRFAARNRVLVGGALGVFVSVFVGMIVSLLMYFQAEEARAEAVTKRNEAQVSAARTKAINEFMLKPLLDSASPFRRGPDVRVVDVLDQAAGDVATTFAAAPDLEVEVRQTLGTSYLQLGRLVEAERELSRSIEKGRDLRGNEARETIESEMRLAQVYQRSGRGAQALELAGVALEKARRALGDADPVTIELGVTFAVSHAGDGRFQRAVDLLEEMERKAESALGPDHRLTLEARGSRSNFLVFLERASESIQISTDVLERAIRTQGESSVTAIDARSVLAMAYMDRGQLDEAEPHLRRAIDGSIRRNGREHTATAGLLNLLANLQNQRGDLDAAQVTMQEAHSAFSSAVGPDHSDTMTVGTDLAMLMMEARRFDEAESLLHTIVAARRRTPDDKSRLGAALNRLGDLYQIRGEPLRAIPVYEEANQLNEAALGPDSQQLSIGVAGMGGCLAALGLDGRAEPYLRRAVDISVSNLSPEAADLLRVRRRLAECLLRTKRPGEALDVLCPGMLVLDAESPDVRARNLNYLNANAASLKQLGRTAEAEVRLREIVDLADSQRIEGSSVVRDAWGQLATIYEASGRTEEAAHARTKSRAR